MVHWRERMVDLLYGHGDERVPDSHGGYLNFGLWEGGADSYLAAAEAMVARMALLLDLDPASRLLDVGCGRGVQDLYLARRLPGLQIDAVDATLRNVQTAQARAAGAGLPGLRFQHGSATRLPFADGTFTHVLCLEAAHHFDRRVDFFLEASRVLRPHGRLALADLVLQRLPRSTGERLAVATACALWGIPAANIDTLESYQAKLRASGFSVLRISEVGEVTFPGYYRAQRSPARRRELRRLRGRLGATVGALMNYAALQVYQSGLLQYLLVSARREGQPETEDGRSPT